MSRVSQPELKRFLERRVAVNIQGGRKVHGVLRGYDLFLNLVIDDTVEQILADNNKNIWEEGPRCGTVVRTSKINGTFANICGATTSCTGRPWEQCDEPRGP